VRRLRREAALGMPANRASRNTSFIPCRSGLAREQGERMRKSTGTPVRGRARSYRGAYMVFAGTSVRCVDFELDGLS
jgi:hypothetical protein